MGIGDGWGTSFGVVAINVEPLGFVTGVKRHLRVEALMVVIVNMTGVQKDCIY